MSTVLRLALASLLARRRLGLAVTVLVLALGSFGVCAGLMVSSRDIGRLDRVAARLDVADVVVHAGQGEPAGSRSPGGTELPGIAAVPGVRAVAGPLPTASTRVLASSAGSPKAPATISATVTALDDPAVPVNRPLLDAGRWVRSDDEIVLERSYAVHEKLPVGSTIDLRGAGGVHRFRVVGRTVDLTDCGYPQCGYARMFTTSGGLARVTPTPGATYWLKTSAPPATVVTALLARYGTSISADTWPDTRGDLRIVDRIFGRFVSAFGVFLLAASAVVVASSVTTRLLERRREVALLGAVGFTPRQVVSALLIEEGVIGLVAAGAGWLGADLVAPLVRPSPAVLASPGVSFPVPVLLVVVGLLLVVLLAATGFGICRTARRPFVELVWDAPPEPRGLTRRLVTRVPARLSLLGLNAAGARPGRAGLRALAVLIAVIGGITAAGFLSGIDGDIRSPARTGEPWDVAVASEQSVSPAAVESVLRATPDVAGWYTQTDRTGAADGFTFRVRALGGEPAYMLGAGRLPRAPGEVAVGYGLMGRLGLHVGQATPVRIGTRTISVRVVGWYRTTEDTGRIMAMRLADLRTLEPAARPDKYLVTGRPGTSGPALADRLSRSLPMGADAAARTVDIGGAGAMQASTVSIAVLLGIVAGANLLASLLTSNAENARTTGVERALGFTGRDLIGQGFVGSAVLGLAATIVGVPAGWFIYTTLANALNGGIGIGPGVTVGPGIGIVVLLTAAAALGCGALGAFAAHRANQAPIPALLRWE